MCLLYEGGPEIMVDMCWYVRLSKTEKLKAEMCLSANESK